MNNIERTVKIVALVGWLTFFWFGWLTFFWFAMRWVVVLLKINGIKFPDHLFY